MFNLPWVKYTVHGSEMICASWWNFAHLSFTRMFLPQDVCDFKLHVYWPATISVRHHCTFSGKSCKFASRFQHARNSGDLVASLAPDVRCMKKSKLKITASCCRDSLTRVLAEKKIAAKKSGKKNPPYRGNKSSRNRP